MRTDAAPLLDILLAIGDAMSFVEGLSEQQFHADKRTRWAVFSQIIVIGEAANRLSREYQAKYPTIPWSEIIGMCNHLVHGYDQVEWERVWNVVVNEMPRLKAAIEPLIPEEP